MENVKVLLCDDVRGWSPSKELFNFYKEKGYAIDHKYLRRYRHCPILLEAYEKLGKRIDSTGTSKFFIADIQDSHYRISNGYSGIERIETIKQVMKTMVSVSVRVTDYIERGRE